MTPAKRRQYGSGSVYQRASDGRWIGSVEAGFHKNGTRRRITVSAATEAEAKRRLKNKMRDLDRGEDSSSRTTVKAWAETWLEMTARTVRPNTHTTDRGAVAWITATIGHRRIDQLTPADVRALSQAVIANKGGNRENSTSTAHRYHGVLMRMLKAANEEGLPVPGRILSVAGPAAAVSDRQAIPTPDVLSILKAADQLPHMSRWVAAFFQGIRQGEALGLLWENVRDDSYIVSWQLQPLPYRIPRDRSSGFRIPDGYEAKQLDGQLHLVRPKSKAGWRVVPLLDVMGSALESWRQVAPDSPHGLVWPAIDGAPAGEVDDREEFYGLQEAAQVGHPKGRYYHVHEARHATATILMEMGVPESVRVAIMGHSTMASTKGYEYTDLAEIRRALAKVEAAWKFQLG